MKFMYVSVCCFICLYGHYLCMYHDVCVSDNAYCSVFFIQLPLQHFPRASCAFSSSLDECWYGRVALIFNMQVQTDAGDVMECQCALIETLYNYCPQDSKPSWPSTAEIRTKLLYLPSEPVVYDIPCHSKLLLVPAGDYGTIP
jgi:hypothetical protein